MIKKLLNQLFSKKPVPVQITEQEEKFAYALGQFPHCDPRILHRPKQCVYCDERPDWQRLRIVWGINFTGENNKTKLPCPAETQRPIEVIEKWHGNQPKRN